MQQLDHAIAGIRDVLAANAGNAAAWHDLGILLQRRGLLAESRAAFERAIALDPAPASSYNNLGNTLTLQRELDPAVANYRLALDRDPTLHAAHANAAGALYQLGRYAEAREHALHALELDPASSPAQITAALVDGALLGYDAALERIDALLARTPGDLTAASARAYVLLRLERYAEAADVAERGLAARPDFGGLLEALGCALRALGRFDEAFAAFDRAVALGHNPAGTLVLKASGQLETGDFEAARATLERVLELDPGCAPAWLALAELQASAPGDTALARMEELLADAPSMRGTEAAMQMHFALGKAYHKAGGTTAAFRHFAAGNAAKRATLNYDVAGDERFARETIAFFTPAMIAKLTGTGDASRAPIFVLGMPRSGTSLVEQILASHPGVHGAGELTLFDRALEECGAADLTALGARYLALVDQVAPADKRVVDKLPSNFRHAALLHLALPRARIVHCVRDPLDTCFSCYTTLFTGRQDFSFDLAETGRYYRAYAALADHWRAVLPPGVMLDVRYEELVADIEAGARRLLAFCDLPWNDAVLRYYETHRPVRTASYRQVREPIYTTSIGSAQRYRPHLQPLIDALRGG
jgi:tetratricopeptide (TPR) repeat protein